MNATAPRTAGRSLAAMTLATLLAHGPGTHAVRAGTTKAGPLRGGEAGRSITLDLQ